MSGIINPNAPTAFYDTAEVSTRAAEVPDADWATGVNRAGSCAPGVGINTGEYDPKDSDWADTDFNGVNALNYLGASQYIGIDPGGNLAVTALDPVADEWRNAGFIETTGAVAPGAVLGQISGNDFINRTGLTVPSGSKAWGIKSS